MKKILICLVGLIPLFAFGRLGEAEDQLTNRFGKPKMVQPDRIIAQGKMVEIGTILHFRQDDWIIYAHIVEGRSARERLAKSGEWTEDQITLVLTANAQGALWTETSSSGIKKLKREWVRTDGATAVWQLGQGFNLTHQAYLRAKIKAEAKAKSDSAQLPKI